MDAEEERLLRKIRTKHNVIFKYGTYTMDPPTPKPSEEVISEDTSSEDTEIKTDNSEVLAPTDEEAAKIAEIMNKFSSNIQDNVNSLFQ